MYNWVMQRSQKLIADFLFECFRTSCLVHCPPGTVHIDIRFNVFTVLSLYAEESSLLGRYAVLTGN